MNFTRRSLLGVIAAHLVPADFAASEERNTGNAPLPKDTTFQAILFDFDRADRLAGVGKFAKRYSASYGTFTLEGPVRDSFIAFPDDMQRHPLKFAVSDAEGKRLYCIINNDFLLFDISRPPMTRMEVPEVITQLTYRGIAYDSKRHFVLLLEARGGLHAFDTRKSSWAKINNVPIQFGRDIGYLTYDRQTDRLYAIHWGGPNGKDPFVLILSAEGYVVKSFQLESGIVTWNVFRPQPCQSQLIGLGKEIGLLTPDRLVLVDIETGKANVRWQWR